MLNKDNKYFWILLGICFVSLIIFLGNALFNTKGEPREAIVAVSMLKYGNWILPVNNGVDIAYKPPFFHWCIALLSLFQGYVSEFTSRLPSALALTAMTLVGFRFYAKRASVQTAFIAGLVTITSFEMHRAGTNCRVDMLLCAMTVIALYQLYKWGENKLRGVPVIAILCMSGAFLTKGPVGILLPCLVTAVFLLVRGTKFVKIFYSFLLVAIASCIIPACWYIAAYRQGGNEFLQLVYEENVLRFLGKMTYESHEQPFYYNFITVISGYLPYTLLLLMSLFALKYKKPSGGIRMLWNKFAAYIKGMDNVRLFSLLSIVIIFVFYCIPKSKRSVYLLPIYPFIAYFIAEYVIYLSKGHMKVLRSFGYTLGCMAVLLFVTFVAVRAGLVPETIFSGKHAAQNAAMLTALETNSLGIMQIVVIMLPLVAALLFWIYRRKSANWQIYSMFGIIFSIFISLDGYYTPTVLNTKSDKPVAMKINDIAGNQRIYSYRAIVIEHNRMHPFTVNFYLNDRVVPFETAMPDNGFVLSGDNDIDTFKTKYPQYAVNEIIDFNHRSCDDKMNLHLYKVSLKTNAK